MSDGRPWERPPKVSVTRDGDREVTVTLTATKSWADGSRAVVYVCKKHLGRDDALVLFQDEPDGVGCWFCHIDKVNGEAAAVLMRVWALLEPDGSHGAPVKARVRAAFDIIEAFSEQRAIDGECVSPKTYAADCKRAREIALTGDD